MNILDFLTEEEKKCLKIKHYKKGKTLFFENEDCLSLGIVLSGELKISTYTFSGKEIIFNIIHQNELFGNNLIFSSSPYYKGYVVAESESEVAFINKNQLLKILKNNDKFLMKFLNIQSDLSKNEKLTIELLSIQNAKERLLFFLKENNNKFTYLSVTSLSTQLNMKRETLSRTISLLEKEKVLVRNNKTLILKG